MRSPDNARQLERNGPALEAGARELAAETYAADLTMDGVPESAVRRTAEGRESL
jgi:hypothetical protein